MAYVYKRKGSPWYWGSVMIHGEIFYNHYGTDKAVAARQHREWARQKKEESRLGPSNRTWAPFKEEFFKHLQADRAHGTVKHYSAAIAKLEAFSMPKLLSDITPKLLYDLHADLRQKNISGPVGRNKAANCIKYMMHWAEQWGYVRPQIWRGIKLEKERKREEYFTSEEVDILLDACKDNPHYKTIVLLGAHAGLRPCEMVTLQRSDIDLKNSTISIFSPKTKTRDMIPITPVLCRHLKDYLAIIPANSKLVLHNGYGEHYSANALNQAFKKILKRTDLKGFPYMLRHSYASVLKNAGVDLLEVSKLMRHRRIETTTIYSHVELPTLRDAIANIPAPKHPENHKAVVKNVVKKIAQ